MSRARSPVHSGQHLSRAALERPVRDGRNPEGALFRLTGLGDIESNLTKDQEAVSAFAEKRRPKFTGR